MSDGIECRHCGCTDLRVIATRRRANGTIIRRRACRHCGKVTRTTEEADAPKEPGWRPNR